MTGQLFTFPPQQTTKLNIPDDEPIYRVQGKQGFFDGGTLHREWDDRGRPTLIAYDGEPNFSLVPMNEKAMKETEKWLAKLKQGDDDCKKHPDYATQGGYRTGVMMQEIDIKAYVRRINDSGRFDPKRIQPAIMSDKVNKATARVIEQIEVETPEIKSVSANKKRDQTSQLNG